MNETVLGADMIRLKQIQMNSKKWPTSFLKALGSAVLVLSISGGIAHSAEEVSLDLNQPRLVSEQFFSAKSDSNQGESFDKPFFRVRKLVYPEMVTHLIYDGVDSNGLPKQKEVYENLTKIEVVAMGFVGRTNDNNKVDQLESEIYRKVYTNEDFSLISPVSRDGLMNGQVTFSEVNELLNQGNMRKLVNLLNRESRLGTLDAPTGDQDFERSKLKISLAATQNDSLYSYTSPNRTTIVYQPTVQSPYLKDPVSRDFEIEFFKSSQRKFESVIRINNTFVSVKTKKSAGNKGQIEFDAKQASKVYSSGVSLEVVDAKTIKIKMYAMPGEPKQYSGNEIFLKLDKANNIEISSAKMLVFANYNPHTLVPVESDKFRDDFKYSETIKGLSAETVSCRRFYGRN